MDGNSTSLKCFKRIFPSLLCLGPARAILSAIIDDSRGDDNDEDDDDFAATTNVDDEDEDDDVETSFTGPYLSLIHI